MTINGATRLYAIVGDPIAQVRSPEILTGRFAALGANAVLVPVHIPAGRFESVMPTLLQLGNLDGVLVTIPFKTRVLPFASRLGATARCIGALNALRREADGSWSGDMFDGAGFVNAAVRKGERVRGRRVALFGAGGAGSAIACALAEAKAASIALIDTDAAKAHALVRRLHPAFPETALHVASSVPGDTDMIVNATPVGMQPGDGMPARLGALQPGTVIGDVVITASPTALIRHAMAHGCPWVDGKDMHSGQVEAIIDFFSPGIAFAGAAGLQTVAN